MDTNTFDKFGLTSGDIIVCSGVSIGAPKGIIGKAFVLNYAFMTADAGLFIDNDDCHIYTGSCAKWRKARVGDGQRDLCEIRLDWDTNDLIAVPTGKKVSDLEKDET